MNLIEKLKNGPKPNIIFGAGIVGEVLHQACIDYKIKVECFCDNNLNKTKKDLRNTPVIHTSSLKERYTDANFLISAADILDVQTQLGGMGYSKLYPGSLLLKDFNTGSYEFSAPADFVEYAVDTAIVCQNNYLNPDKLFLRSLDIIVTERCSLKCRDCSNLMRYYQDPKDCNTLKLIHEIDKFCGVADEINEFRVLGGEPFMNKEAHLIIKRLIDEPKAKKVVIYTNGTIIPREEQINSLQSEKSLFIITDYAGLSKNLDSLIKRLSQKNIAFYVQKANGWTDCSRIEEHNRTPEQQKEIFEKCCAKNTFTLSNGKLYRCPYSANADRLRATPDFKGDYIDLLDETLSSGDIKKKVRQFLLEKEFLETCDFCSGRSFGDAEIQPAIQMKKHRDYKRYTR